jgi:pilus assembly protein CpaC
MRHLILIVSMMVGLGFGIGAHAANDDTLPPVISEKSGHVDIDRHVTITRGKSRVIEVNANIADVLVADPSVIEVGAMKSNRLYLIGAALGDTNVMIFDGEGNAIEELDVHVRVDEVTLQKTMEKLFPDQDIIAKTVNDDIMLTGSASNPSVAARIQEVAARFAGQDEAVVNMMTVKGEQQVMLKVKVLEISRNILNELGLDTDLSFGRGATDALFSTAGAVGLTAPTPVGAGQLLFDAGAATISTIFQALERDGYITTLAEPNLTAITGQNARFLAGGEFPIPTEIDDEGNVTYEYKPFGVSLAFKPTVMSKNRINLSVSTEVSNISNDFSFELENLRVPGFDVRRAETSVEMPSGGTLMLAGLIESNTINSMNRIPGIKNVPVIGDLTGSESFQRNETELVVMISAYLVKPFSDTQQAAKEAPKEESSPLKQALISNLKRVHGTRKIANATQGHSVGYLLD